MHQTNETVTSGSSSRVSSFWFKGQQINARKITYGNKCTELTIDVTSVVLKDDHAADKHRYSLNLKKQAHYKVRAGIDHNQLTNPFHLFGETCIGASPTFSRQGQLVMLSASPTRAKTTNKR